VRFIGSKEHLLPFIEDAWRRHVGSGAGCVGDLFCGTAAVSRLFKKLGNKVVANDNLRFGYVFAQAALNVRDEPAFHRLLETGEVAETAVASLYPTPYDQILAYLNSLTGDEGFFFREYSPGGTRNKEFQRCYFSDDNAKKIDAIRRKIGYWQRTELVNEAEGCLLLSNLMRAANRVANIAGTYGCFIKHWDPRAQKALALQRSPITSSLYNHEIFCMDANALVGKRDFDALYLDPPYTWRHYGAYYHILETIAQGDEPQVSGRTGLRPWEQSKSRYCDRSDAVNALREIVLTARTRHLFLSYNEEGLIPHDQIVEILRDRGKPACLEVGYRRFRSNNGGSRRNILKERLYYVQVEPDRSREGRQPSSVLAQATKQRTA
jgi:adenine-specific DNA-methyltransferase